MAETLRAKLERLPQHAGPDDGARIALESLPCGGGGGCDLAECCDMCDRCQALASLTGKDGDR